MAPDLTQLSLALVVIYILIKDVLVPILKERNGSTKGGFSSRDKEILETLYEWHKPGPDGRQTWKATEVQEQLKQLRSDVVCLKKELQQTNIIINDIVKNIKDVIEADEELIRQTKALANSINNMSEIWKWIINNQNKPNGIAN